MGRIRLEEQTEPATPPAGYAEVYVDSADSAAYLKNDAGVVTPLAGGAPDTDSLPEGATNLYFTNERAQDAVGAALTDTATIDLTYNDGGDAITADLRNTTVTPASYGSATQVPGYTVDAQGRLTAASNTAIAIPSTAVTDFTEAAQDAVGAALTDSASVDLTYNDAGGTITAAVLPGGVDHDALSNFVANEHVDHSSVSIADGDGITGGGNLTATRTLSLSIQPLTTVTAAVGDLIPIADVSNSNAIRNVTVQTVLNQSIHSRNLPLISGRWYDQGLGMRNATQFFGTTTPTANIKFAQPFYVPVGGVTLDRLGVDVQTADAGASVRLGIYNDSNGLPGSLLLDAGSVTTTPSGERSITISQALSPNTWYWFAINVSTFTTLVLNGYDYTAFSYTCGLGNATAVATQFPILLYVSETFGALASTFGTGTYFAGAAARTMMRVA